MLRKAALQCRRSDESHGFILIHHFFKGQTVGLSSSWPTGGAPPWLLQSPGISNLLGGGLQPISTPKRVQMQSSLEQVTLQVSSSGCRSSGALAQDVDRLLPEQEVATWQGSTT